MEVPIFLTERTELSDEVYAVIGRALAFATSFEMNCKAVQAVIGIQELRLTGQGGEAIEDFCEGLEEKVLKQRLDSITKKLGTRNMAAAEFFEWLSPKLKDAKEARNTIAHDVAKGIEHCVEHGERHHEIMEKVEGLVRTIAEADFFIYNLCQALTGEPTYKGDYCEDVVKWVCEVELR